jgi:hypothetical protein
MINLQKLLDIINNYFNYTAILSEFAKHLILVTNLFNITCL